MIEAAAVAEPEGGGGDDPYRPPTDPALLLQAQAQAAEQGQAAAGSAGGVQVSGVACRRGEEAGLLTSLAPCTCMAWVWPVPTCLLDIEW